ncbi:hypothetical protein F6V25_08010 [Oryzomonas japonica]|uniref:Uncharacterized protein n=1 Tax=Oryzomonas japonica TaxID=2603858 RepID=A0A7J4ZRS6_9BACT|nr:hypothetical protein [Oryzomonas japonica]KAB0665657.1 hypothetical protein F6V25_08010 [Oryzomonas japonica]
MEWAAVISAVLGIAALVLRQYLSDKAKQEANSDQTNIQTMRKALADNDGAAVDAAAADQHDRVLSALGGGGRGTIGDSEEEHY